MQPCVSRKTGSIISPRRGENSDEFNSVLVVSLPLPVFNLNNSLWNNSGQCDKRGCLLGVCSKGFCLFYFVWGKVGWFVLFVLFCVCLCVFFVSVFVFWLLREFTRKCSFLFWTLSSLYVISDSGKAIILLQSEADW